LGDSPAFEFCMPTFQNTSAYKIQTPGNHPKESIQHSKITAKVWNQEYCIYLHF